MVCSFVNWFDDWIEMPDGQADISFDYIRVDIGHLL